MAADPVTSTIVEPSPRRRVPLWTFAVLATFPVALMLAPKFQAAFFPVLGTQQINRIVRTPGLMMIVPNGPAAGRRRWIGATLCWERFSVKNYAAVAYNIDEFLDRRNFQTNRFDDTRRSFPEVWFEGTHDPISTETTPPAGESRRRLCIDLPTKIRPDQPIRLQQYVHFKGLWGLWDLSPVALPEIISPTQETTLPG